MNLKKIDGGVWVKASDELPDKDAHCFCRRFGKTLPCLQFLARYSKRDLFHNVDVWGNTMKHETEGLEWLKPIKDVYVLTEDELKELISLAFTVGGAYDVQKYSGKDMMGLQNKKQFIQSITK